MSNDIQNYKFLINGLPVEATYHLKDINDIFIPLLQKLSNIQKELDRRIVIFIGAAPGTGKSTLSAFLEYLSKKIDGLTPIQSVGLDGFHYDNNYLKSHCINDDDSQPLLISIKGSLETFDLSELQSKLDSIQSDDCLWPSYSRTDHDVINNAVKITEKIIVLEGNYLLLNINNWDILKRYADYTIFVYSDKSLLKSRLIERKIEGGSTDTEANMHFNNVDAKNIDIVLKNSSKADSTLFLNNDLSFKIMK